MKWALNIRKNYFFLIIGLIILLGLIEVSARLEHYFVVMFSEWKVPVFLKQNLGPFLSFFFIISPLLLAELFLPNDEKNKNYKNGLLFWFLYLQSVYFAGLLTNWIVSSLKIAPLIHLTFESVSKNSGHPLLLNIFLITLSLFVFDLFYYLMHRAQHSFPVLWEIHKAHHSIRNLNAIVSYHHFLDDFCRVFFIYIPLAFLVKIDAPKLAILSSFYIAFGQFIHMNSKINLGPLRYVFSDNYFHRIHHSIENKHHNKNFSAFFPFWDVVFRSAYFPKKDEFPEVGLPDDEQPTTIKEYLLFPNFLRKRPGKKISREKSYKE